MSAELLDRIQKWLRDGDVVVAGLTTYEGASLAADFALGADGRAHVWAGKRSKRVDQTNVRFYTRDDDGKLVLQEVFAVHVEYGLERTGIPESCIAECSAQGAVDDAVEYWVDRLNFSVDLERARRHLREFGAWDESELANDEANARRILWTACCDFKEGKDFYALE
jgi:hypothetical protein